MKAIVQDAYGSADVLKLMDIEKPNIGDDEVLLRVHASVGLIALGARHSSRPNTMRVASTR
jgi:NADPH:quinone reductase-like Zn-dependent oxidoreductase